MHNLNRRTEWYALSGCHYVAGTANPAGDLLIPYGLVLSITSGQSVWDMLKTRREV